MRLTKTELAFLLPRLLIGLAVIVFIGYFVVYNMYAFALFRFPFDYDQGEGFELVDTLLFSQGQWPYRDNNSYPYYSSNYPPVFHLVIVPLVWLFGPQYWTGRLVAYLGTLITGAAIGYAVQRETRRPWLSVVCALSFFASNHIYHVGPLLRQHLFMVMFETVAVVLLTVLTEREEAAGQRDNRRLLWVMVLLLLAGYTKQLAYATVAAVFIFMFLRTPKRAVVWAIPFAAVTGLIFLGLNIATNGHWFTATVTANVNPFVDGQAVALYRRWWEIHAVLIVFAALMCVWQLYFGRLSLYAVWFVVTALNSVTAGKWGAGESYFATTIVAGAILAGMAIHGLLNVAATRKPWQHWLAYTAVPLLLLWQADMMYHLPTSHPFWRGVAETLNKPTDTWVPPQTSCSDDRPARPVPYVDIIPGGLLGRPPTREDIEAGKTIAALIEEGETAALSEEAGFNLYANRDVVSNPTQLLNLFKNGMFDPTEMLADLDDQAFDTIILRAQFYPYPVLQKIGERYTQTDLVEMNGFVYCIYRPNDPTINAATSN